MKPPEHFWFHDAVSALAYSCAEQNKKSPALQPPFNDITQFILQQRAQMPDYLRAPMLAATLGFDAAGFFNGGKNFHCQPPELRRHQIAAWKNSNSGFKRDLIRYFESLTAFALYSRDHAKTFSANPEISEKNVIVNPGAKLRAEIVVVGSGPGGAITACLLAEAGRDVLLVEEGNFYPQNSCEQFSKGEMLQKYRNGGQTVAFGKNKIGYVEGRCVGGGSEINSALYHRTPPEILERWRKEFQVEALSEKEMQPHFETLRARRFRFAAALPCAAGVAEIARGRDAARLEIARSPALVSLSKIPVRQRVRGSP